MTYPTISQRSEPQWISRQMLGMRLIEAAISSRKIDGTICATGRISEIAVMESSEKPKPENPRTIAARKIAALDSASTSQSLWMAAHNAAIMQRNPGDETPPALYWRAPLSPTHFRGARCKRIDALALMGLSLLIMSASQANRGGKRHRLVTVRARLVDRLNSRIAMF